MTLSQHVFARLSADAALNSIGFGAENIYGSQAIDSVPKDDRLFMILMWRDRSPGLVGQRGPLRVYEQNLDVYTYNRDKDFAPVRQALRRIAELADEFVAEKTGTDASDGWITCCDWAGETDDGYDEVYEAVNRIGSITFVASGT